VSPLTTLSTLYLTSASGTSSASHHSSAVYKKRLVFLLMHPEFSAQVQRVSDAEGDELSPQRIWKIFNETYIKPTHPYNMRAFASHSTQAGNDTYEGVLTLSGEGGTTQLIGLGNGPIDACRNALLRAGCPSFRITNYAEHARSSGSDAEAVSFIQIQNSDGKKLWGAGIHPNIETSSIRALVSAVNRAFASHGAGH